MNRRNRGVHAEREKPIQDVIGMSISLKTCGYAEPRSTRVLLGKNSKINLFIL